MKTTKPKETKTANEKSAIKANQKNGKAAVEGAKSTLESKVEALKKKIKTANAGAKSKFEQRITELKADNEKRQAILQKARKEMDAV